MYQCGDRHPGWHGLIGSVPENPQFQASFSLTLGPFSGIVLTLMDHCSSIQIPDSRTRAGKGRGARAYASISMKGTRRKTHEILLART